MSEKTKCDECGRVVGVVRGSLVRHNTLTSRGFRDAVVSQTTCSGSWKDAQAIRVKHAERAVERTATELRDAQHAFAMAKSALSQARVRAREAKEKLASLKAGAR